MLHLDVRSIAISTTVLFLSLVVIRFLCRRSYRAVPGYWAWTIADAAFFAAAVLFVFRNLSIRDAASVFAGNLLLIVGFELRHLGATRFLELPPQRLASLLPDVVGLITVGAILLQHDDPRAIQSERLAVLYAVLIFINLRTTWLLLRARAPGLTSEIRILGFVTGFTAAAALAGMVISAANLQQGHPFAYANWTAWLLVMFGLVAVVWSFLCFRLASAWIEQRRELAVEAQQKTVAQFRLLLDESPIPTAVLAPRGWIERVNRKFVEVTGYSLDEIPSEARWWDLVAPEPEKKAAARKAWHEALRLAGTHAPGEAPEVVVDLRNRPSRTLELHARRVRGRVILQLVDVSEMKAAMQAREAMVAEVSHDLKSPLSSILLRVEALMRSQADPKLTSQARAIRQSAWKMVQMIRDLLDTASLDSGRMRLKLMPTDVAKVIEAVVDNLSPLAEQRSTRIVCVLDALDDVVCDGARLARVLTNLIGNAIKFTSDGTITVRAERRAGDVLISVVDTGDGIAPEVLPRVFDRYFTTGSGQDGSGLGLHIVKGIVEAHGGRIWAASDPGKGSNFSFTLPQPPVARAQDHEATSSQLH
jgi:PAS domain S-box-containing protein